VEASTELNILKDEELRNRMVLVDTSIWIDHFNSGDSNLECLLNENQVVTHHFVIGELACGNFKNRKLIYTLLTALPLVKEISREEFYLFLDHHKLFGTGIGFVDVHLLASALISNCQLYTRDKSLLSSANKLKIAYK
jgi:predicted nucleic acid-binding protein